MLGTSAQGLTMTIPPALTMLPETGRVTVTVPWLLLVVLVLVPPACTIWAPAKLAAGMVIIPTKTWKWGFSDRKNLKIKCKKKKRKGAHRVYPVAGQYRLHWQADRQWSVRQRSVLPAGPARWSAAPEEAQRVERPPSVLINNINNYWPLHWGEYSTWFCPAVMAAWGCWMMICWAWPCWPWSCRVWPPWSWIWPGCTSWICPWTRQRFSEPLSNASCDRTQISWQEAIPFRGRNLLRWSYFCYKNDNYR